MINIIKQEIPIDESLKKKLEFICDFCNTTPTFINGSIRKIDKSNLAYVEPHKVIINNELHPLRVDINKKTVQKEIC